MWLNAMIAKKIPVSGGILKQRAEVFALRMNVKTSSSAMVGFAIERTEMI